jgi:two-component system sensor histidine kinase HydH
LLVDTERMASLGELSARLMQELRSPLSAIAGFARRLEKGLPEGDPSREDAAIVAREAHRLEELLTQHSELARPTMPKLSPQALNQISHEAVVLLRDELTGHGIFLEEAYGDPIPDLLLDADRIRQVVLSTLRNAMDSLRDGDTIRIETLREGDRVLLEIARTGEQLPGEILERLFAPFSTPRPSGVGLALAVAQQVVKEHGGEISVRTEDEWGAIFTISFPIRANQERRKIRDRRSGRDRRRGRKKR